MALMSIDLGTSSVKVTIYEHNTGDILAFGRGKYTLITKKLGQVEQDPNKWWEATKDAIKICLFNYKSDISSITGIGLSGQMCGVIPVDKKGNALHNCITYLDTRCKDEIDELKKREEEIKKIGMNPISNLLSAPKLLWLKNNQKQVWKETYKWLMPKDYIRLKLTGTFGTDVTDASATLFMDFINKNWDPIIEELGLDATKFVNINESHQIVGSLTKNAADETGLKEGTPVVAGGADMACTALGTRATKEGNISLTVGTAGHLISPINHPNYRYTEQLYQFCHAVPDMYYAFGAVFSGGLSLSWFKDILVELSLEQITEEQLYQLLNEEAEKAGNGSSGLFFLPFLTGSGIPYSDPKAKGCFIGLTVSNTVGEMARAIMEGVAYNFKEIIETMSKMEISIKQIYLGEGGSKSTLWTNILTSIINRGSFEIMKNKDSAPVGAAILAGIGTGVYPDWEEAVSKLTATSKLDPNIIEVKEYECRYEIYKKLYPALKDVFREIHEVEEKS